MVRRTTSFVYFSVLVLVLLTYYTVIEAKLLREGENNNLGKLYLVLCWLYARESTQANLCL